FGYMGVRSAFEDLNQADRASAILAIAGVVNVPIIHFSVVWWASLHQGPTLSKMGAPSISGGMLWPLLTMILAFTLFFLAILATRVRGEVLEREVQSRWAQDVLRGDSPAGVNL
ncbi:MAG: cytochrome c biogenesis protein, partial [Gammaproteobacteria bacterium]